MAGQLTLALIKPHVALGRNVGRVITRIEDEGFGIVLSKMLQLRKDGARQFYEEHKEEPFYENLCNVMSSGAIWALVLAKPNAVEEWRNFIGATAPKEAAPGTLRHEFGDPNNITNNAVHGSATDIDAKREIYFFFGREIQIAQKIDEMDNPTGLSIGGSPTDL